MLTLVIFLIIIILVYEPEENGIQRAAAFKAAALSMDSKEACVEPVSYTHLKILGILNQKYKKSILALAVPFKENIRYNFSDLCYML